MSFRSFNCHHIHARNGQELGYDQVAGRAHPAIYLDMAQVEIVCPALYQGGDRERKSYSGPYTLISMSSGDAHVVEGVASEIADHVTGTVALRHINLEKLQNPGGNVLAYSEATEAWVRPDAVEAIERAGYRDQGYTDGVSRAMLLLRSGAILTLYGVTADTIATKPRWFRG